MQLFNLSFSIPTLKKTPEDHHMFVWNLTHCYLDQCFKCGLLTHL